MQDLVIEQLLPVLRDLFLDLAERLLLFRSPVVTLAESVIGLYKTEVTNRRGPWRTVEAVELATLDWVDWFNHSRLLAPIGYVPPVECEEQYYASQEAPVMVAGVT